MCNCAVVTLETLGDSTSDVTVDCSADNGGCDQVCVPGKGTPIGHCGCFSNGYQLVAYGLVCEGTALGYCVTLLYCLFWLCPYDDLSTMDFM